MKSLARRETSIGLFAYRVIGAALLDASVYEGVEADRTALGQATAVVLLSSVAAGIGASGLDGPSLATIAGMSALALVTWAAWAMLMFQIGARVMPEPQTSSSPTELMRTIGFAAAPGLLQVLAVLPRMRAPVFGVVWIWTFVATVMAVRHALDYRSTVRTLVVCGSAAALALVVALVIGMAFGPALS